MGTPLPEIRKTLTAPRLTRSGATGPECWAAETTDGVWSFERFEEPGTPWGIYHNPSLADNSWRLPVMTCGSLRKCQEAVARGIAERQLALNKAEVAER